MQFVDQIQKEKATSKWIVSSSEDEEDENSQDSDNDSESQGESSSDENAADEKQARNITVNSTENKPRKNAATHQLSKKERELLRQKELNDLDSLLSSLTDVVINESEKINVTDVSTVSQQQLEVDSITETSKKKKKQKKLKSGLVDAQIISNQSDAPVASDVATVLKNKIAKKTKKSAPDAVRIALEQSTGTSNAKKKDKKKRDKSKYNETSY